MKRCNGSSKCGMYIGKGTPTRSGVLEKVGCKFGTGYGEIALG